MKGIILIILLISSITQAKQSLEVIGGSLTYHLESSEDGRPMPYDHTLTPDHELIDNALVGVGYINEYDDDLVRDQWHHYWGAKFFAGENSVGQPMTGLDASWGGVWQNWYIGFVLGGYVQNTKTFEAQGVIPPNIATFGDTGLIPIVGAEFNYRLDLSQKTYLKLNSLVTPALINESLSLGFDF